MSSERYGILENAALNWAGNDSSAIKLEDCTWWSTLGNWQCAYNACGPWDNKTSLFVELTGSRYITTYEYAYSCYGLVLENTWLLLVIDYLFMNVFTNPLCDTSKIFLVKSLSLTLNNSAVPWLLKFVLAFQIFSAL